MHSIIKHKLFITLFALLLTTLSLLRQPTSTELLSPGRNIFYLTFIFIIGTILGCFIVITYDSIIKKNIKKTIN